MQKLQKRLHRELKKYGLSEIQNKEIESNFRSCPNWKLLLIKQNNTAFFRWVSEQVYLQLYT